jgi:methionyl-tRNA formyltransferase
MRIGVLANSLPAAQRIYEELKDIPETDTFVLLCPAPNESSGKTVLKHAGRLAVKPGRLKSLRQILQDRVVLFDKSLEHSESLERLRKLKLDIGLHKAGVIYRRPVIEAFRLGILNPHIGMLPAYRGRNVMEWSLLQGDPVGITVFFIDEGIDTGERILISEEVDISSCKTVGEAKQQLFDLDATFFRRALELLQTNDLRLGINDGSGKRYYVMSKLFRGVVQQVIEIGN